MNKNTDIEKAFKQLGLNISTIRKNQNISIKELAEKSGIKKEYIEKIEKGEAHGVRLYKHLAQIAKVLNVDLSELFVNL